ncbi:hypothetical protein J6590_042791 [Homalodisca vitripennis]|nr:hypothetical protein J6590_042791 [Homalodisca vitripennis]
MSINTWTPGIKPNVRHPYFEKDCRWCTHDIRLRGLVASVTRTLLVVGDATIEVSTLGLQVSNRMYGTHISKKIDAGIKPNVRHPYFEKDCRWCTHDIRLRGLVASVTRTLLVVGDATIEVSTLGLQVSNRMYGTHISRKIVAGIKPNVRHPYFEKDCRWCTHDIRLRGLVASVTRTLLVVGDATIEVSTLGLQVSNRMYGTHISRKIVAGARTIFACEDR